MASTFLHTDHLTRLWVRHGPIQEEEEEEEEEREKKKEIRSRKRMKKREEKENCGPYFRRFKHGPNQHFPFGFES